MLERARGFALYEMVLCLALLGLAGGAVLRGVLAVGGAVTDGRRWSDLARLGSAALVRLELVYRRGAPSCVPPLGGSQAGRGVVATWAVTDGAGWIDVTMELRLVGRRGAVDTVFTRISCR